jgi:hypothetical protein
MIRAALPTRRYELLNQTNDAVSRWLDGIFDVILQVIFKIRVTHHHPPLFDSGEPP